MIVSKTTGEFPRIDLGFFPTLIEPLARMGAALGIELTLKRDDYTGFGGGGNKVRKLEYLMADALAARARVLITTGGHQSNHARMVAAAACRFGMRAILVLRGNPPEEYQGNLLLDRLFGATLEFLEPATYFHLIDGRMEAHAEAARAADQQPYIIPLDGTTPSWGAWMCSRSRGDDEPAPYCSRYRCRPVRIRRHASRVNGGCRETLAHHPRRWYQRQPRPRLVPRTCGHNGQ